MNNEQNKKNMINEKELQNAAGGKTPSGWVVVVGQCCPRCKKTLYYDPVYDYKGVSYCSSCYDEVIPQGVDASW